MKTEEAKRRASEAHEAEATRGMRDNGVVTLTDQGAREAISAGQTGSGGDAGHGLPLRHGVEAMKMGGQGGATGTGRDEEIADGGEDGDEPLQASRVRKPARRVGEGQERKGGAWRVRDRMSGLLRRPGYVLLYGS